MFPTRAAKSIYETKYICMKHWTARRYSWIMSFLLFRNGKSYN